MNIVNAVVLAGGKSKRLGQDKTQVCFNGQGLLARTVRLAQEYCGHTVVVGRDPRSQGINAPWLLDETPGLGPIGGIITALRTLQAPCLVLTCDLPFLDRPVLDALVRGRESRTAQTVMTSFRHERTGYIEPLVAVYEREALTLLESAVRQCIHKLNRAVPENRRTHLLCIGPMAKAFFNLNHPAELFLLRELEMMHDYSRPESMHAEVQ